MLSLILRRLGMGVLTVFGLSVIIFVLLTLLPGDPLAGLLPENAQPEDREALAEQLGINDAAHVRYVRWLGDVVQGDLGYSPFRRRDVRDLIADAWKNTAILAFFSATVGLGVGVLAGTMAAINRGRWPDRVVSTLALTGLSVPSYWIAILLIIIFAAELKILPASGMHGPEGGTVDFLKHLAMPLVAGCLVTIGVTARVTRTSVVETFSADFVDTLRAKGLSFRQILGHVLKNAASPVLTTSGLQVGTLLGGAVLIETIFSWPGLGSLTYTAITARDLKVVQGSLLLISVTFVLINLIVDIFQILIDPRLRRTT